MNGLVGAVLKRLRPARSLSAYDSYDVALASSDTYEDEGIVRVVSAKTAIYRDKLASHPGRIVASRQTAQNMFVVTHVAPDRPLRVIEIGGACGASYIELGRILPGRIGGWLVIETPAMVKAARGAFSGDALEFSDDISGAKGFEADLVVAQGVLQYLPDLLGTLRDLAALGCAHIYITRTVVAGDVAEPVFTKQTTLLSAHGPGPMPEGFADRTSSQPLTLVSPDAMIACVSDAYDVALRFQEGGAERIKVGKRRLDTYMAGLLLARKAERT